jgi:hypothetical protein
LVRIERIGFSQVQYRRAQEMSLAPAKKGVSLENFVGLLSLRASVGLFL